MSRQETLFKKDIRKKLGIDWLRFYYSRDKTHICIMARDIDTYFEKAIRILERENIEYKLQEWLGVSILKGVPYAINIPLDQECVPQVKRKRIIYD